MSGLIRSFITRVTRTGKTLLNGQTSHGRNTRHTFFEPKVICSCLRRNIMQCSIHNQCSGLFICIMDYLHVLCMTLMVWICVLCMTLMMFIYVYYGLFICINLVDVMLIFFTIFPFQWLVFWIIQPVFDIIRPEIVRPIFGKSQWIISKYVDNSVNLAEFWFFRMFLFLSCVNCFSQNFPIFADFFWILQNSTDLAPSEFLLPVEFSNTGQ
jgi:hypothetical protein